MAHQDPQRTRPTRIVVPPYVIVGGELPAGHPPPEGGAYTITPAVVEIPADLTQHNALGLPMVFPLSLRLPKAGERDWLLPLEPMITISGKHVITKRQVAKGRSRGSVKERWTLDDYTVRIEGILQGEGDSYPEADVRRLRRYCEAGEVIATSPLLELFGISRLIIESWETPHTSGANNQNYSLSCLSDDTYKLLLK